MKKYIAKPAPNFLVKRTFLLSKQLHSGSNSCPPFGEGEIQGLFQDFKALFSKLKDLDYWEKSLKMAWICLANNSLYSVILIKITNVGRAGIFFQFWNFFFQFKDFPGFSRPVDNLSIRLTKTCFKNFLNFGQPNAKGEKNAAIFFKNSKNPSKI
jgi:hypothetical protein